MDDIIEILSQSHGTVSQENVSGSTENYVILPEIPRFTE